MQRVFAASFDFPSGWDGYRARQFKMPSDAFQQFVGEAFKDEFGNDAWVAGTLGRDGGIDVFVEMAISTASGHGLLKDLGYPLIVECKSHDESAKDLKGNIEQEWRRVALKLEKSAQEGWPDNYLPWRRAQGYLYCISARFPSQAFRESFQDRIRRFFAALPSDRRPPIALDKIHVWDWSDLANFVRRSGRLADRWLGIPSSDLVDHGTLRERIAHRADGLSLGFRAYLLNENLKFIPPEPDDISHPECLFRCANVGENILLIGEGGIGKTRTVFEVAELANQAGWRVLHLDPPDIGVDPRSLLPELVRHAGHTLLVVDYIDKLQQFDARYWHQTIIPEVARRGGRLSLIANARPADSEGHLKSALESGLFREVMLAPSAARRAAVAAGIESSICPHAVSTLGIAKVRQLCGARPIIAMFIARELEALTLAGNMPAQFSSLGRPGDLMAWLRRRLRESSMLPVTRGTWDDFELSPHLCAAVAVLAAAPMTEIELQAVATATLVSLGKTEKDSTRCLSVLKRLGWLEPSDVSHTWRTPHDIIADEVLGHLLSDELRCLPNILAAATQGRPLGRFALSLARLIGQPEYHRFRNPISLWLEENAKNIGTALLDLPSDISAYALGAVFDCPPWHQIATERWTDLVAPWLEAHGQERAARHLLYQCLKLITAPSHLLEPALTWLGRHREEEEAGFVLAPLLTWNEAQLGSAKPIVLDHSLAWLAAHGRRRDSAPFVLRSLLTWDGVRLGKARFAVHEHALNWLNRHGEQELACYLLNSVLMRDEVHLGASDSNILKRAFDWLKLFNTKESAKSVLYPLLRWDEQRLGDSNSVVLDHVITWLKIYGDRLHSEYILRELLAWDVKRFGNMQHVVLGSAISWIKQNDEQKTAGFVLAPLLLWDEASLGSEQTNLLARVLEWLQQFITWENAGFVLHQLLRWEAARLRGLDAILLRFSLQWLKLHYKQIDSQYTLSQLLAWSPDRLGEAHREALELALNWLIEYGEQKVAGFVLAPLLLWDEASLGESQHTIVQYCITWMKLHSHDAHYLLEPLAVWNESRLGEAQEPLLEQSLIWLEHHGKRLEAGFLLKILLSWKDERHGNFRRPILGKASLWLEEFEDFDEQDMVLVPLIRQPDLMPSSRAKFCALATNLIKKNKNGYRETDLLRSLLKATNRFADEVNNKEIIITAGLWLDKNPDRLDRPFVMLSLLRCRQLPDDAWVRVAHAALLEAAVRGSFEGEDRLLFSILLRFTLLPKDDRELWSQLAQKWLATTEDRQAATKMFEQCCEWLLRGSDSKFVAVLEEIFERRFGYDSGETGRQVGSVMST